MPKRARQKAKAPQLATEPDCLLPLTPQVGNAPADAVGAAIDQLSAALQDYLSPTQAQLVARAARYAAQAHDGQQRDSGEPFIMHPLAVAGILGDMRMDAECIAAGLLHDVQEDCSVEPATLRQLFGDAVAMLVDGVTKLDQIEDRTRDEQQADNFQKMMLAMARDIRVILLKLVDRLHNIRTIGVLPRPRQRRIARETLSFYAPIAARLGMDKMRVELEERAFSALYPMRARLISSVVERARGGHRELIADIKGEIEQRLQEESIEARVYGREKSIYAIYDKVRRGTSFADLMDVFGFRIIVNDVRSCYHALGVVHSLYKPVPSSFDDYIAIPKPNGYQSLHTALFGRQQVRVEVQIRTHEMEEMANHGIAAHWLYKGSDSQTGGVADQQRLRRWVRGLLEMQRQAGDSLEFLEQLRADLYSDEIFVITPKGAIRSLPCGATPLDFAYAIHSNIGDHCAGCKVNRRISTRSTPLSSGQTVEILTDSKIRPSPEWLAWVVTPKARARIRQSLRRRQREDAISLGRQLLENRLISLGTSLAALGGEDKAAQLLRDATGNDGTGGKSRPAEPGDFEQQLAEIGFGDLPVLLVAHRLVHASDVGSDRSWWDLPRYFGIRSRHQPLSIHGSEGLVVQFGGCCGPVPGDQIIGQLSAGRGLVVHAQGCHNLSAGGTEAAELVPLQWAEEVDGEFSARLAVAMKNGRGALAQLASRVQECESDIEGINIEDQEAGSARILLTVGVRDRVHLASIMRGIHRMSHVSQVHRQANQ